MINKKVFDELRVLAEENEITFEEVVEIYKKSLVHAYPTLKKSLEVELNPDKNEINVYDLRLVSAEDGSTPNENNYFTITLEEARAIKGKSHAKIGDVIKIKRNPQDGITRNGVISMKNVMKTSLLDIKKARDIAYFKSVEGEMVNAVVKEKIDDPKRAKNGPYFVINIGRDHTTTLPYKELLANDFENLQPGDKIKVYIKKVEELENNKMKVLVSRLDRNLVFRLLESYVPEIASGVVEVKGIARDAGDKTKLAVYSNDPKVDAIGSIIGEGSSRIEQIKTALNGEKIELYLWSENIEETISGSLQPARVTKVLSVDVKTKSSVVVVPDEQLSLAIGKNGQNVRLAVQSCGWKIDILSLTDAIEKGLLL